VKGSDPSLEALAAQAATTTQDPARKALYQQIQESMNTDGPFMPLIQPAQILVGATALKNLQSNALWIVNLGELG
jgi:peptide/nickel transport system substrate-binding protein